MSPPEKRAEAHRLIARGHALLAEAEAEAVGSVNGVADDLMPYPFGFERRAATGLVRQGALPTTKIGRRTYARRSDVLALVGKTASARDLAPAVRDAAAAARAAYAAPLRVVRGSR